MQQYTWTRAIRFSIWAGTFVLLAAGCLAGDDSIDHLDDFSPDAGHIDDEFADEALPASARSSEGSVFSCQSPTWLRVVSANMGHLEFDTLGEGTFASNYLNGGSENTPAKFVASQAAFLRDTVALKGQANVLALQEIDNGGASTGQFYWPFAFEWVFDNTLGQTCSDYDSVFSEIFHSGAGSVVLSNLATTSSEEWLLGRAPIDCEEAVDRPAQVVHMEEGGIDAWVVNVHLQVCEQGNNYEENLCNLTNLAQKILSLPTDDVVVVAGDFNINPTTTGTENCNEGWRFKRRYDDMTKLFYLLGFQRLLSSTNDHIFVRDPNLEIKRVANAKRLGSGSTLMPIDVDDFPTLDSNDQNSYQVSDHSFLQVDLGFAGSGISPVLLPTLVSLL
jgi:endonuclease/exonuclease/phosphatase family metal-dependent hydrolase